MGQVNPKLWLLLTSPYRFEIKFPLRHWNKKEDIFNLKLVQEQYKHFDFLASLSPLCPVCVSGAIWINPHHWGDFGPPKALTIICNRYIWCLHHKCLEKGHPSISFTFVLRSLKRWANTCIPCKLVVQSPANYMLKLWPTMTQKFPYLPRVYNTYSVVNFTSNGNHIPTIITRPKTSLLHCKWWKNTSSLLQKKWNTCFTKHGHNAIPYLGNPSFS